MWADRGIFFWNPGQGLDGAAVHAFQGVKGDLRDGLPHCGLAKDAGRPRV